MLNDAKNEDRWDAFVLEHGGGFLQSWGWSHFQEALGRTVYRYALDEPAGQDGPAGRHEDVLAQFLLVINRLPFGQRYAYVPWGPVIRSETTDIHERLETVTVALREAMRREGAMFARVDFPYLRSGDAFSSRDLETLGFVKASRDTQPPDSVIIDLQDDEEALLAAMHQKTRYNIRLAERHGVVVRDAEHGNAHLLRRDIDIFWRMLGRTAERDRFHTHPRKYYETMVDVLSEKKRSGCTVKLMLAERGGEAVAAGLFAYFGDTVTYLHGASLTSERKFMAPYLLHWKVMTEAKARGFRRYDLWGVALDDDPAHKWAGITRFKKGFGGNRVGYLGTWELPNKSTWYKLYRSVKKIRG